MFSDASETFCLPPFNFTKSSFAPEVTTNNVNRTSFVGLTFAHEQEQEHTPTHNLSAAAFYLMNTK